MTLPSPEKPWSHSHFQLPPVVDARGVLVAHVALERELGALVNVLLAGLALPARLAHAQELEQTVVLARAVVAARLADAVVGVDAVAGLQVVELLGRLDLP